jgi:hypothetical protein
VTLRNILTELVETCAMLKGRSKEFKNEYDDDDNDNDNNNNRLELSNSKELLNQHINLCM